MSEFSKEGRKLRPRKSAAGRSTTSEKVDFNSEAGQRSQDGEHRSFGERKSYGERRSYGEKPAFGERRSFGGHRSQDGERRSFGGHRSQDGEHKSYGERRSFGDKPAYGERRNFGGHREENGEHKGFGGHRNQDGERKNFGERRSYGDKPAFRGRPDSKGKRPYGKNQASFNKDSNEGINRMISRRPVVNDGEYQGSDPTEGMIKDVVRLNKFIANSGVCSRREADTLIQAGVVTVNGEVITELGTKVNIYEDDIRFNGERLRGEEKVYLVMNKPKGFVTTASDPHADKTVIDLVKSCNARVYPVGRLDKNTTGVLMLTNDGEIAERLTHPSYDKKKIYQVILDAPLTQEHHDQVLAGVTLTDGEVAADELEYIDENDKRKIGIEIHSGKNRVVRRIFESLGYSVKALDRVYFAGLTKKGLKKGEWRFLTESEVNILKMGAYL